MVTVMETMVDNGLVCYFFNGEGDAHHEVVLPLRELFRTKDFDVTQTGPPK